ncbi:MAG: TolB family protein [Solirubrobacteraceae bacterium]
MSVGGWIAGAAITGAGCAFALAGPADAKISGTPGHLIAFDRRGEIRVMSDQGAGVPDASINVTSSPGVADSAPSWGLPEDRCNPDGQGDFIPPNGRTLVYQSRPKGSDSDVVLTKLTGNPPRRASSVNLTAMSSADDGAPAVGVRTDPTSFAGTSSIVFTRGPIGRRDIWAMRLDGSSATRLTSAAADDRSPDWSSDGTSVVYETVAGGRQQLAILDVAYDPVQGRFVVGGPARFITAGAKGHGDPSWWSTPSAKPDPSRILHVTTASGETYLDFIEQVQALTSGARFAPTSGPAPLLRQLTGDPGGDLAPSWSPQGDRVVFEGDRGKPGNRDIYRTRIDGTELVRLTRARAADHRPDWEPYSSTFCLDQMPYRPRPGTPRRKRLRVKKVRAAAAGTSKRRIVVRFSVSKRARASLLLRRGGRAVARKTNQPVSRGNATIRLNVPSKTRGGRASLRLTIRAGSAITTRTLGVKIRSRR